MWSIKDLTLFNIEFETISSQLNMGWFTLLGLNKKKKVNSIVWEF